MNIYNANHKFRIPVSKEVLLTKEVLAEMLPEFRKDGIKRIIKDWIHSRIEVERTIDYFKELDKNSEYIDGVLYHKKLGFDGYFYWVELKF
ncbi:hypothetical protein LCGC14_0603110 [marine sediment metagenome]|uniref:Uncharacterized protein n=1 Tax=marine sediment metagenome TaxID=412755 RepID=A0A0F9TW22_9ZZZZ